MPAHNDHRRAIVAGDRLPPPVPAAAQTCLFLDVDGTLLEFASHPRAVRVDPELLELLSSLRGALGGALALISGRSIEELDRLLYPLQLPVAGLHGAEMRDSAGHILRPSVSSAKLRLACERLQEFVAARPGLLLEDKQMSLAVHFRAAPQLRDEVASALARIAAPLYPEFRLLPGEQVLEIKPSGWTKATAVESFMREPAFASRRPVFVGDDLTDCDGFSAVAACGGMSVAVGGRVKAQWYLSDPAAVRIWLNDIVKGAQNHDN